MDYFDIYDYELQVEDYAVFYDINDFITEDENQEG